MGGVRAANANPSRVSGPATPPGKGRARPLDAPSGPGERVAGIRHACPGRSGSTPPVHPATGPRLTRALPVQSTPLRSPLSMRSAIPDCPVHHVKLLSGPGRPLPRPHHPLPVHRAHSPVQTARSAATPPSPGPGRRLPLSCPGSRLHAARAPQGLQLPQYPAAAPRLPVLRSFRSGSQPGVRIRSRSAHSKGR